MTIQNFRVSKNLKDIIGRELVTDKFVAVFELIKNSIDAGAKIVQIEIDPNNDRIFIIDDGCGMAHDDITNKWLFVAYSDKADDNVRDREDFRDKIKIAGRKGIGRFSCDTLGSNLHLFSRTKDADSPINFLQIDWSSFEDDSISEFSNVNVDVLYKSEFPRPLRASLPKMSGTLLEISNLRHSWEAKDVKELRTYLAKLIDPFNISKNVRIITHFVNWDGEDKGLNGQIGNDIAELLTQKSSRIHVEFDEGQIYTELFDRGTPIFSVSESNNYHLLNDCRIAADLYYLNRSAKLLFRKRMGMRNVSYGSMFLFLNGFRIFPIGEETDDSFRINTRKMQSFRRRLGTRDIIGRIDVSAPTSKFKEVSSRDAGLIRDESYLELREAILDKIFYPLERYVVGVNWKDNTDQDRETFTGFDSDSAKLAILKILGDMKGNSDLKILHFDRKLIEFTDKKNANYENVLMDVKELVYREGNPNLVKQFDKTITRLRELENVEVNAQKLVAEFEEERVGFKSKISALKSEANFLAANQNFDEEKTALHLHQNHVYCSHLHASAVKGINVTRELLRYLHDDNLRENFKKLKAISNVLTKEAFDEFSYILLQTQRLQDVLKFATIFKSNGTSYDIKGDLISFLTEYFSVVYSDVRYRPEINFKADVDKFVRKFSPFDLSVIFDNLIDNARKAEAKNIWIHAMKINKSKELEILIKDDGIGIDSARVEISRIFNKNYTSNPIGTGLGLFHVQKVLQEMGGNIALNTNFESCNSNSTFVPAEFIITIFKERERANCQ